MAGKRGDSGGNVGWNARVDRACSMFGGVCLALASTVVAPPYLYENAPPGEVAFEK